MKFGMQVHESRVMADPPLLRVENEGAHAYLSMLLHLSAAGEAPLLESAQVEARLIQLCTENMQCFVVCSRILCPVPLLHAVVRVYACLQEA